MGAAQENGRRVRRCLKRPSSPGRSTFAVDGKDCRVNKDVERVLKGFHQPPGRTGGQCVQPEFLSRWFLCEEDELSSQIALPHLQP